MSKHGKDKKDKKEPKPSHTEEKANSHAGEKANLPVASDAGKTIQHNLQSCQNIGLLLSKHIKWNANWLSRDLEEEFRELKENKRQPLDKKELYKPILNIASNPKSEASSQLNGYLERFKATLISMENIGWQIERLTNLKTEWRMVVGLGSGSILETSMTLHRIYGFPIIPGSASKGLTKAYANIALGIPDSDEQITRIFGSQSTSNSSQGKVIFFDAIPLKFPKLKVDIMNPHYGKYYSDPSGKTPPADYLDPNPILFLTVDEGVEFYFAVASKENGLASKAKGWLENALKELGVGAKTSAGYGYFE